MPSISTEPNASSSPVAQSIASWATIVARRWSCGSSRGCGVNPSGKFSWVSMISLMVSSVIAVATASCPAGSRASGASAGRTSEPGSAGWPAASLVSVKARSSSCW